MAQKARRGLATWLTAGTTPVFVLDERRVILVFNSGCEALSQWTAAEVIGKTCDFQHDPNPERVTSLTGALCPPGELKPGQTASRRVLIPRKDGTRLEREIAFFPLGDGDESGTQHTLGMITECRAEAPLPESPHLEISRHTAHLFVRYGLDRLVATTPAMQRVAAQIEVACKHPVSVHVRGERGSGREHIARLIHYSSPQRARRFVPVRCETASHHELNQILQRLSDSPPQEVGTVYLDEVTVLPGDLQPLVLSLCRTPGRRWISSSTEGLDGVAEEAFQPGLAAQLTALTMTLPPLRDRIGDLPLLAQQLLEECNAGQEHQHTEFATGVLRLFQQYAWPGNIDELSRVVLKACQKSTTPVIETTDLPAEFAASLQARAIRPLSYTIPLDEQLAQFERTCILDAMKESRGNKSLAAEKLGIPRAKLYRRLEQLGLEVDSVSALPPEIADS